MARSFERTLRVLGSLLLVSEVGASNATGGVEAVLPAPPRLASWYETAKKIKDIKQKIDDEFVTVVDGKYVVHHRGRGRQAEIAQCVFSSLLAAEQLASAGMAVTAAVATCGFGGVTSKVEACTANIGAAVACLSGAASFMAELAIICPSGDNWRASCANPILTLVSGLGGLAAHSAGASQSCGNIPNGATIFNPVSVDDETGLANCIINANQGAAFLGRAGIQVDALANGACDHFTSDASCTASVTGTLISFASAASFLGGAVSKCTAKILFTPACAANVAGLAADLLKVANFASALAGTACRDKQDNVWTRSSASNRRMEEVMANVTNVTAQMVQLVDADALHLV
mmetsp:Transcript_52834/g.115264  ORF Transcript_52834/g.115264 Transcript_52834/m.115264 type:complete len:347 (+) Transcript_52834:48-1088(+)